MFGCVSFRQLCYVKSRSVRPVAMGFVELSSVVLRRLEYVPFQVTFSQMSSVEFLLGSVQFCQLRYVLLWLGFVWFSRLGQAMFCCVGLRQISSGVLRLCYVRSDPLSLVPFRYARSAEFGPVKFSSVVLSSVG